MSTYENSLSAADVLIELTTSNRLMWMRSTHFGGFVGYIDKRSVVVTQITNNQNHEIKFHEFGNMEGMVESAFRSWHEAKESEEPIDWKNFEFSDEDEEVDDDFYAAHTISAKPSGSLAHKIADLHDSIQHQMYSYDEADNTSSELYLELLQRLKNREVR